MWLFLTDSFEHFFDIFELETMIYVTFLAPSSFAWLKFWFIWEDGSSRTFKSIIFDCLSSDRLSMLFHWGCYSLEAESHHILWKSAHLINWDTISSCSNSGSLRVSCRSEILRVRDHRSISVIIVGRFRIFVSAIEITRRLFPVCSLGILML